MKVLSVRIVETMLLFVSDRSHIWRIALALALLTAWPALAAAQVKVVAQPAKSAPAESPAKPQPRVVRMTVSPAAAPRGALRYRLLPEYLDLKPGNRADLYHRAMLLAFQREDARKTFYDEAYNRWTENQQRMLLPEGLSHEQIRNRGLYGAPMKELETAAWRQRCDWGLNLRELTGAAPLAVLLPELDAARHLGRMLSLRCRLEIAEGRLEDAHKTLQMHFQLARDMAETPTLVSALVGIAMMGMAAGDLQQLLQRADAPNLYWALTALPRPFISLHEAMEQERSFMLQLVPALRDANKDRSPEEWRQILLQMVRDVRQTADSAGIRPGILPSDVQSELGLTAVAMVAYPTAKRKLIEYGRDRKEVEAMPVAQVVLLYAFERYQELWGDVFKAQYLPLPQAVEEARRADQRFKEVISRERGDPMVVLSALLLPAVNSVMGATGRSERAIDELRTIEALRMYAAERGHWPASLDEVKQAPIPLNPFTGKPFEYRVEGETAILEGAVPAGQPVQNAARYELKLRAASLSKSKS